MRWTAAAFGWAMAVALCVGLGGCGQADMVKQGKSGTWDQSEVLPKRTSMQLPVAGTVPRDEPNAPVAAPPTITAALIERGHERYDIFCTPCHGITGNADGIVVQRGFPKPPKLTIDRLMNAKAQYFAEVIANGKGVMYSYADRVPPADRWAVAAYIRALQLSQKPVVADLPPAERDKVKDGTR